MVCKSLGRCHLKAAFCKDKGYYQYYDLLNESDPSTFKSENYFKIFRQPKHITKKQFMSIFTKDGFPTKGKKQVSKHIATPWRVKPKRKRKMKKKVSRRPVFKFEEIPECVLTEIYELMGRDMSAVCELA